MGVAVTSKTPDNHCLRYLLCVAKNILEDPTYIGSENIYRLDNRQLLPFYPARYNPQ